MTDPLYDHQRRIIDRMLQGSYGVFAQPGTGKTRCGIELARWCNANRVRSGRTLVIAPLSILESAWLEDLAKFAPELKGMSLWAGTPAKREKLKQQAAKVKPDLLVVNYAGFVRLADWLVDRRFDAVILDESSKIKSPRTTITKTFKKFSRTVPRVYVFSGTPMPNTPLEVYEQIDAVARGILERNFYAFRAKWFSGVGYGGYTYVISKDNRKKLMETIAPYCILLLKVDCLDLPEKTFQVRKVSMDAAQRRAYDQMVKDKILPLIEDRVAISSSILAEIMKLRQVCSGWVYDTDRQAYQFSETKLQALDEVLEDLGPEQVIIWCQFRRDIEQVEKRLGDRAVKAYGGMNPKELKANIDAFKAGGKQYLIAHPQSVGHGHTMVNCSYCIYLGLSYSLEEYLQSQDRIHRIGAKRPCTYIHLLARESIDEVIYRALQRKENMANATLEYLREYRDD